VHDNAPLDTKANNVPAGEECKHVRRVDVEAAGQVVLVHGVTPKLPSESLLDSEIMKELMKTKITKKNVHFTI
jgi:hypothetical protein